MTLLAPALASRIAATASGIDPRCTGMCSACMTNSPPGSNRAVEQSRRSLMFGEWAERIRTAPISSQTARSRPTWTPRLIGSRLTAAPHLGDHRSVLVHLSRPARGQNQGRLRQLEHGRPLEGIAGRRLAASDQGVVPLIAEVDAPRPLVNTALAGAKPRLRGGALQRQADGDQLDGRIRNVEAEALHMRLGKPAYKIAFGWARARFDREFECLTLVAQLVGDRLGTASMPSARLSRSWATAAATASAESSSALIITVRAVSLRRADAKSPSADRTPPARGQIMRAMPISAASSAACIGPAPPNGKSAKSRGSIPWLTVTTRNARTISAFASRTMPTAVASSPRPSCSPTASTAAVAASESSSTSPARLESGASRPRTRFASVTVASVPPRP